MKGWSGVQEYSILSSTWIKVKKEKAIKGGISYVW